MGNYYAGKFSPVNIAKYEGDYRNIRYRSLWERQCFKFLDESISVKRWSSEETIVPYICQTDRKPHRYFVDLKVTFSNGDTHLIEIKPKSQTIQPKKKRMSKRYLEEVMTWAKNQSKWESATNYCQQRGWKFSIWTEDHLRSLGIKLLINEVRGKVTTKKTVRKTVKKVL